MAEAYGLYDLWLGSSGYRDRWKRRSERKVKGMGGQGRPGGEDGLDDWAEH